MKLSYPFRYLAKMQKFYISLQKRYEIGLFPMLFPIETRSIQSGILRAGKLAMVIIA